MLANLHVKNFALIDEADIELSDNLNILTGETGAGKSILLGAINLALGARTAKDTVRANAEYALAELTFTGISEKARRTAEELGFEIPDDEIVISRKLMANGRSIVRINGETATSSGLKDLTEELIDIYGQNEHQSLLNVHKHLEIVDRFAGEEAAVLKSEIASEYSLYSQVRSELDESGLDASSRQREADLLSFELKEIAEAALKEGEEEELKAEHRLLANSHIIAEALAKTGADLYGDGCISDLISDGLKNLSHVSELDEKISGFYSSLMDADGIISDLYREISDYISDIPESEERLHEVEERLDLISRLKSKYGNSVSEINTYAANIAERLEKLNDYDNYISGLTAKLHEYEQKLEKDSMALSRLRGKSAGELEERITAGLLDLNFNSVKFIIVMDKREGYHPDGTDRAEFLISLNPGEDPKPLARIASGGEMSRIMLAIKTVLAGKDELGTLVFDEIDAGISGRTAQKVSEKLCLISQRHQVICITHLPQIAAMADTHFSIEKLVEEGRTVTRIEKIDAGDVTKELARLIGGASITEGIRESAAEIKRLACERKSIIRNGKS